MSKYKNKFKEKDRRYKEFEHGHLYRGPFTLQAVHNPEFHAGVHLSARRTDHVHIERALAMEPGSLAVGGWLILPVKSWATNNYHFTPPLPGELWNCRVRKSNLIVGGKSVILAVPDGPQPNELNQGEDDGEEQ